VPDRVTQKSAGCLAATTRNEMRQTAIRKRRITSMSGFLPEKLSKNYRINFQMLIAN
jgi:hypothetical protein